MTTKMHRHGALDTWDHSFEKRMNTVFARMEAYIGDEWLSVNELVKRYAKVRTRYETNIRDAIVSRLNTRFVYEVAYVHHRRDYMVRRKFGFNKENA